MNRREEAKKELSRIHKELGDIATWQDPKMAVTSAREAVKGAIALILDEEKRETLEALTGRR